MHFLRSIAFVIIAVFINKYGITASSYTQEPLTNTHQDVAETHGNLPTRTIISANATAESYAKFQRFRNWEKTPTKMTEAALNVSNTAVTRASAAAFSGLVYLSRRDSSLSAAIRMYELSLAMAVTAGTITHRDLWIPDMPCVEMVAIHAGNIATLMQERGLSEPPMDILDGIMLDGETHSVNVNPIFVPRVLRLPSLSTAEVLVVGGERQRPDENPEVYTINFDPQFYPDIQGMAEDPASLVVIPNNRFSAITFDFVDQGILLEAAALFEYLRILKPGGLFTFKTPHNSKGYYEGRNTKQFIKECLRELRKYFPNAKGVQKFDKSWRTRSEGFYVVFEATK